MIGKRMFGILFVSLAGLSVMGCGLSKDKYSDGGSAGENETNQATEVSANQAITGEITVLTNRTDLVDNKFAEYKALFEERYPGTTVTFCALTNYEEEAFQMLSDGAYGDVLMIPGAMENKEYAKYFESLGTIEDLSVFYDKDFLCAASYGSEVYGLASGVNMQGVVYNKRVFDEAGVKKLPKTPDEFLEALKQIKTNTDAIPYYTNYAAGWTLGAWQDYCWGGATGDPSYHQNGMVEDASPFSEGKPNYIVHKLLYDIVKEGLCEEDVNATDWEACKGMLNRGEIGCMALGSWAYGQMQAAGDNPQDIGYMAFPISVNGKQYATAGTDYCYAVSANSNNKETAKAWITYMMQDTGFAISEGSISIYRLDPNPGTAEGLYGVELVVDSGATPENVGKFNAVHAASGINLTSEESKRRIVEAALSGKESFDDIMNDWNTKWSSALENYNSR